MFKRAGLALGFTLIEMAIVLVVIGLVVGGGVAAVGPALQNSRIAESSQKLDRIEQALILHVIRYGCLPCPATPGTASTGTAAGQAVAAGTPYTSGCQVGVCTNTQGVVPWINLAISESDATDGFGTRISYAIATSGLLQQTNGMTRTLPSSYPVGDLVVNNASAVEVTGGAGNRAAYVLISHGPNRAYGFLAQVGGTAITDPFSSVPELANSDGTPFVQDDFNANQGVAYFDDLVRWRGAALIIQLCGMNACGNPA
ncbi:MAG: prepilin-type N-terminal cleavage/methylation domain-containing protein [Rhodospirillaceae bacterium]|nr:prepilin-type N-terminal cleavage/methylation domain-containing protein [Rhodospirillaceae bacterium]